MSVWIVLSPTFRLPVKQQNVYAIACFITYSKFSGLPALWISSPGCSLAWVLGSLRSGKLFCDDGISVTARALVETGPQLLVFQHSVRCGDTVRKLPSQQLANVSDGPLPGELVSKLHAGFTLNPVAGMMEQS